ncbi:MAG: type I restriction enzyme HsdR N-terminal domain-containing protein [Pirellulaceae bacterium]|nr:type I restriction enzyme HsdR N-terminal domain-containing protein [Pirellulaceae bacterium]
MAKVPSKISDRIANGIKRFQPILSSAKSRDVGESDTVTIIVDMLSEIFGYDKYSEITSEHAIRGTYCDLAIKIETALQMLIEVKAIGLELKEAHVKQAVDYAANQGVEWVVLTNGLSWRVYKVTFGKPIGQELVINIDFCGLSGKNTKDLESLFLFCKEGWIKSVLGEYHTQKQALSRFFLGAMILSDPVLAVIRRELKRVSPDVRVEIDEIKAVLTAEVLKREVLEGDNATDAKRKINRAASKQLREKSHPSQKLANASSVDCEPEAQIESENEPS